MARKRGFFAELQRQAAQAEKQRQQAAAHAARMEAHNQRMAQMAAREAERRARQDAREHEALRRQLAAEAKQRHQRDRLQEIAALNQELAARTADIENLFSAAVQQLAPVDRARFHIDAVHPVFQSKHDRVVAPPPLPQLPPEPVFSAPAPPHGLSVRFGGAKKHSELVARLRAEYQAVHAQWDAHCSGVMGEYARRVADHEQAEAARRQRLNFDRMKYQAQCEERTAQAAETNRHAEDLLRAYDQGDDAAVRDFIEVCLGMSDWPDFMPDETEIDYVACDRELTIVQTLPSPDVVPTVREYRYRPASDDIGSTKLPVTERKRLYRGLVAAAAARTLAEVFADDTGCHVATVSYRGVVQGIDPATGRDTTITLVAVATDRQRFGQLELGRVDPEATLKHLGGVMSKSPLDLQRAPTASGVRTVDG